MKNVFQIAVVLAMLAGMFSGCEAQRPIRIGLSVELTGSRSELGVAARDGAQLAVEALNEAGGIAERRLELVVYDDKGDPDTARRVDRELLQAGVVAIIGHITSGQSEAVYDQINKDQIVMISPTTTSTEFDGKADYFFRVMSSNDFFGRALAGHVYKNRQIRQVLVLYDLSNRSFSETFWRVFEDEFGRLGGQAEGMAFRAGTDDLKGVMERVIAAQPDAVLVVASAIDTALLAQYGQQMGLAVPLFGSVWAQTNELLEKGGRAVEGMELVSMYDSNNPYPRFQDFLQRYQNRYHHATNYAAAYSYEAVLVLAQALAATGGEAAGLPEALVRVKDLEGVQGRITMNEFGEVNRDAYIVAIEDGDFAMVNVISAAQ